ncbi:hypothetical protein B0T16DRAFT_463268 [Cercophora newfieldiana]|uniref:Uncharacterized protein n=1 Tax=Cercophora newfieldiana TaxID=92897 RepID=A0AA39XSW7_9PEZI|nr:hypothetical protein B0T16DRAFT_463268 [Cercophora newfieldiana]
MPPSQSEEEEARKKKWPDPEFVKPSEDEKIPRPVFCRHCATALLQSATQCPRGGPPRLVEASARAADLTRGGMVCCTDPANPPNTKKPRRGCVDPSVEQIVIELQQRYTAAFGKGRNSLEYKLYYELAKSCMPNGRILETIKRIPRERDPRNRGKLAKKDATSSVDTNSGTHAYSSTGSYAEAGSDVGSGAYTTARFAPIISGGLGASTGHDFVVNGNEFHALTPSACPGIAPAESSDLRDQHEYQASPFGEPEMEPSSYASDAQVAPGLPDSYGGAGVAMSGDGAQATVSIGNPGVTATGEQGKTIEGVGSYRDAYPTWLQGLVDPSLEDLVRDLQTRYEAAFGKDEDSLEYKLYTETESLCYDLHGNIKEGLRRPPPKRPKRQRVGPRTTLPLPMALLLTKASRERNRQGPPYEYVAARFALKED